MKYHKECNCWSPSRPKIRPAPVPVRGSFTGIKTDASTKQALSGAVFTLFQNGQTIASVTSGADGSFSFSDLRPGAYELIETSPPEGYLPETEVFQVTVDAKGNVTINGMASGQFSFTNEAQIQKSEMPVINNVLEGSPFIIGYGIPGAAVSITLPDGSMLTTEVNADGIWLAVVPGEVTLRPYEIIQAYQTEIGKSPSDTASTIVLPQV